MARRGVHWRAVARTRGNGRGSSRRGLARQVGQGVKWLGIDGQGAARLGWAGKALGFEAARLLAARGKEGPAGAVWKGEAVRGPHRRGPAGGEGTAWAGKVSIGRRGCAWRFAARNGRPWPCLAGQVRRGVARRQQHRPGPAGRR
jgi:hypothetical protein